MWWIHAAWLGGAALAMGAVGWFLLGRLRDIAREAEITLSGATLWVLEHEAVALGVPSLGAAACAALVGLSRSRRWIWLALGTLLLVGLAVLLLTCFLQTIAPLYQTQSI
jgi:hypothetical protein